MLMIRLLHVEPELSLGYTLAYDQMLRTILLFLYVNLSYTFLIFHILSFSFWHHT